MIQTLIDISRHTLSRAIPGILLLAFIGALLVIVFEGGQNEQFGAIGDANWCVLVTMTIVGYGGDALEKSQPRHPQIGNRIQSGPER